MQCWKSSDKVLLETSMNHHSNRSVPGADRPLHSAGLHRAFALSFLPCKVPKHSKPCSLKLSQSGNACRERAATISLWSASRRFCAALSQPSLLPKLGRSRSGRVHQTLFRDSKPGPGLAEAWAWSGILCARAQDSC